MANTEAPTVGILGEYEVDTNSDEGLASTSHPEVAFRWSTRPEIVTIRDNEDYSGILLYS